MSASSQADTTTKLSYLLPTGTFLTFQVLAPLATNNGRCGLTEQILTTVTLAFLTVGCILTSFTDSYTAPDGHVYYGFITYDGLWVLGYGSKENHNSDGNDSNDDRDQAAAQPPRVARCAGNAREKNLDDYIQGAKFEPQPSDYVNAAISATAFLTLTMFTDPVSSCFYPHLSETLLKTLPVLLATVLSFCCSFATRIRHGYGNAAARMSKTPPPEGTPLLPAAPRDRGDSNAEIRHRGDNSV